MFLLHLCSHFIGSNSSRNWKYTVKKTKKKTGALNVLSADETNDEYGRNRNGDGERKRKGADIVMNSPPLKPVPFSNSEDDDDYIPCAQPVKYRRFEGGKAAAPKIHTSQRAGTSTGNN